MPCDWVVRCRRYTSCGPTPETLGFCDRLGCCCLCVLCLSLKVAVVAAGRFGMFEGWRRSTVIDGAGKVGAGGGGVVGAGGCPARAFTRACRVSGRTAGRAIRDCWLPCPRGHRRCWSPVGRRGTERRVVARAGRRAFSSAGLFPLGGGTAAPSAQPPGRASAPRRPLRPRGALRRAAEPLRRR